MRVRWFGCMFVVVVFGGIVVVASAIVVGRVVGGGMSCHSGYNHPYHTFTRPTAFKPWREGGLGG